MTAAERLEALSPELREGLVAFLDSEEFRHVADLLRLGIKPADRPPYEHGGEALVRLALEGDSTAEAILVVALFFREAGAAEEVTFSADLGQWAQAVLAKCPTVSTLVPFTVLATGFGNAFLLKAFLWPIQPLTEADSCKLADSFPWLLQRVLVPAVTALVARGTDEDRADALAHSCPLVSYLVGLNLLCGSAQRLRRFDLAAPWFEDVAATASDQAAVEGWNLKEAARLAARWARDHAGREAEVEPRLHDAFRVTWGAESTYSLPLDELLKLAEQGESVAQFAAGHWLLEVDDERGLPLLEKAAAAGNADAAFTLGEFYLASSGREAEALKHFCRCFDAAFNGDSSNVKYRLEEATRDLTLYSATAINQILTEANDREDLLNVVLDHGSGPLNLQQGLYCAAVSPEGADAEKPLPLGTKNFRKALFWFRAALATDMPQRVEAQAKALVALITRHIGKEEEVAIRFANSGDGDSVIFAAFSLAEGQLLESVLVGPEHELDEFIRGLPPDGGDWTLQ